MPRLENHRLNWTSLLKKEFKAMRKSPTLRKSEAPVSLLQLQCFALETTIIALPDAEATGKMIKAGVNLVKGFVKFAVTSDPRAVLKSVADCGSLSFEAAKRAHAEYYAKHIAFYILRSLKADIVSLEEVRPPRVHLQRFLFDSLPVRPPLASRYRKHGPC